MFNSSKQYILKIRPSIFFYIVPLLLAIPPIICFMTFNLSFDPVFFINEYYKFLLNIISLLISFSLIYLYWDNHKASTKLKNHILHLQHTLKDLLSMIEECKKAFELKDEKSILLRISLLLNLLRLKDKEFHDCVSDEVIKNNYMATKILHLFIQNCFDEFDNLIKQEFWDINKYSLSYFISLEGHIITTINALGALYE